MKEKLNDLIEKIKANKKIVIRVGVAVGVAALATTGVALAIHLKNEREDQAEFENEELTRLSELEEDEEETEE